MFLFLRIIVFAFMSNTLSQVCAEIDANSQNYTIEFVKMVNNLTQMSNVEDKNVTKLSTDFKNNTGHLQVETPKIMLVFPNRSFKDKLTPNVKPEIGKFDTNQTNIRNTTLKVHIGRKPESLLIKPIPNVKPEIGKFTNQTNIRNTTQKVHIGRKPESFLIKPIRRISNIRDKEPKLANLQRLISDELTKTYNKIEHEIQNRPERTKKVKRVYIRRRKINKINNENKTENQRRFVRRQTYFKLPTEGLQIIGPIPSGFYGLKSSQTTYDGIIKSDLELPNDQNKKILINTGVISPLFLNFVKQKYDEVLELYEKAVANYNVYNELYNKAKELGTI